MGRPPIDYGQKIAQVLGHIEPPPREADCPIQHFQRTISDLRNLRAYVERKIKDTKFYRKKMADHMAALDRMLIVSIIETFERFLKEIAAVCVDQLAKCVLDDRFDFATIKGGEFAAHFGEQTLGKALCEASTWLDCKSVNTRFRRLLSLPSKPDENFQIFRNGRGDLFPGSTRSPYDIASLVWQLRHTIVHNVGVMTQSDGTKFQILAHTNVSAPGLLRPSCDDVRHIEDFLSAMADDVNKRCCGRLAEVLTELYDGNPRLFQPAEKAKSVAKDFQTVVAIAGETSGP